MRILTSIAILLLPLLASAGIYKWMGPDGSIHYADQPVPGAERVGIQVERVADPKVPKNATGPDLGPYDGFEIVSPEPNQTLRNDEGSVDLSLLIEPPLAQGHRLRILVNGQPIVGEAKGTQIRLSGLAFGSHRMQVRIQNDQDETIASSPAVDFHLRKPLPEELRP